MKTNRPFEYTRYPEEREKLERVNARLGCLFIAITTIFSGAVIATIIYLLT
jgi:hypothetical protein